MDDANGQPLSLGSGFCVGNGMLASNIHVIAGAAKGYAKLVGEHAKYDIEGIAALSPERDLVVPKISGGCSRKLRFFLRSPGDSQFSPPESCLGVAHRQNQEQANIYSSGLRGG